MRPFLNDSGETSGVADEAFGSYGPLALYWAGTAEIHFRDISYKDFEVKRLVRESACEHIGPAVSSKITSELHPASSVYSVPGFQVAAARICLPVV